MMLRCPRPGTPRSRRWRWAVAAVALVAVTACGDDSDDSDEGGDASNGDTKNGQENGPEQGESTNGGDESLEASGLDQTLRLTVDSVARENDLVVIEGTITNTGNERFRPWREFAELDFGTLERSQSHDLSGFVVVDWERSTAHYPARTDTGDCACTILEDRQASALDPGASMDYFVAYELDDPSSELTLVAPLFQPLDRLPVEQQ